MCQFFQLQSPFASCKMQDWFTELMQHFKIVYVKQSTQMRKYLSDSFSFCLSSSVCLLVRGLKTHRAVHYRSCCTGWATPARAPAATLATLSGWETVSKVFSVSCYSQENSNLCHLETKMMLNECNLSPSLVCQVVERLCQGEGRCTVAVTSHQDHCADRWGGVCMAMQ